ncbi:hypothetical protein HGM15179_002447 [Zosterops borbonicus]|uniref:Uncharacterized protein n=1 Tax=Zosterops borbonicus TaxID=364589 RepID=A0A8K1GWR2_9PASS|nr:hypothetical protein HGM15179_002447 [Zosterops borbonicus]
MPLAFLATWAHSGSCSAAFIQYPQAPFCQAAVQPLCPQPVVHQGIVVANVQDPGIVFIKPRIPGLGPSTQPVQVPLQSPPTPQQINTPLQLSVICKFANGKLNPLIHIINKDIKQDWAQHRSLEDTTSDWLPDYNTSLWAQPCSHS